MADYREAFVGIDVAKMRNAVAIADAGRQGKVRFFGEVDASATNMRRVIVRVTKAGNGRVRHMLVESAWTYRHPPKIGKTKLYRLEQASPAVREIAWKAQSRLTARYRKLVARGKRTTVVCTAMPKVWPLHCLLN